MRARRAVLLLALFLVACSGPSNETGGAGTVVSPPDRLDYAIAIHGGAGSLPAALAPAEREGYESSLRAALELGRSILAAGGDSLDAVEQVIRLLEDDPRFNAGKGAVFNHDGRHELDASLMDGATLGCGAVAGVTSVKNPISLARLVMERTDHVLLAGDGAERFAEAMEVERVPQEYFFTAGRYEALQRALERERQPSGEHGTVGAVALDRSGNLAAGTSTGGLTAKQHGRVGDSPIIGAGTYAKNATCAVSATGVGEEFIRHSVAHTISDLMEFRELSLAAAAETVVGELLRPGDGGVIAVGHDGSIAMAYNTASMLRGAADSTGRFEIWIRD